MPVGNAKVLKIAEGRVYKDSLRKYEFVTDEGEIFDDPERGAMCLLFCSDVNKLLGTGRWRLGSKVIYDGQNYYFMPQRGGKRKLVQNP